MKRKHSKTKKVILLLAIMILPFIIGGCTSFANTDAVKSAPPGTSSSVLGGLLGNRTETVDILLLLTVLTLSK